MTGKDIEYAKKLLEQGELVAIPTETVYGLAANAYDKRAVKAIFEAKKKTTLQSAYCPCSWRRGSKNYC